MGGLKPIGSEKLQGIDKLNRIMEIARYKEHMPKPINENSRSEYEILLADGRNYQIVKEKNGYVIKKSINESLNDFDYIEPMKNRRYFSSYSQAFKRLNLVAKEVNLNEGVKHNVSLFNEGDEETKYFLKFGDEKKGETTEQAVPAAAPAPAPVPAPAPAPAAAPAPAPEEVPMGDEEMPMGDEEMPDMEDEEMEDEDEVVTFKTIQKVTGKLAQKIRTFNSDEENEMSSKDIKYVINSVLSALNLDGLEEEDLDSIIDKLEGVEDEEGGEEMPDMEGEEMPDMEGEEVQPEVPVAPEGEMAEGIDFDDDEDDYPSKHRGSRRFRHRDFSDDDSSSIDDMFEQIFSESKVDNVLSKYFDKKTITESKKFEDKKRKINERKTLTESVRNLSNNTPQEFSALKLIEKYPNAKFLGKTVSHSLVFEAENKKISVSTKGGYKLI
jgi:hypothetical protein